VFLFLAGCAGIGKRLEPPRVTLSSIVVQKITIFETTIDVKLRVFNANDIPIEIKGTECDLELMGNHFATGVSNKKVNIPSYESATVPIVVYSSVVNMIKSLLTLQNKEKLQYKLSGRIRIEGNVLFPSSIPFKSEGELPLEGFQGPPS
jgi:LEA14-like dessication related protein